MYYITNIIPASTAKKAILYDPDTDDLIIQRADVVGLIEIQNPDDPQEVASAAMYMIADDLGIYSPPQMHYNFIELIEDHPFDTVDLSDYLDDIEEIKKIHTQLKNTNPEIIEVEQKGNVSTIKTFIKRPRGPKK